MEEKYNKKKRIFLLIAILIFIPIIWFFFLNKGGDVTKASSQLTGKWLRYDGVYTLEITSVNKDGTLSAKYFNPDPIEVGPAKWSIKDKKLQVFVELEGAYQKSNYNLVYDDNKKILVGTFYQAVAKETYEVYFNKVK